VKPGRGSVLVFETPTYFSSAGIELQVTVSPDAPDMWYGLFFRVVDEGGNEVPTQWLQGGISGFRRGNSSLQTYMVPVDPLRLTVQRIPTLRIMYYWAPSSSGFSGYLYNNDGSEIQTIIKPLNWHTQQ
jgi:hypothetical protein